MFFGKHLCKAQAQQLTESNEQMAPQAKDAGKSERSPRFDIGVFLLWEMFLLFFLFCSKIPDGYGFHRLFLDINDINIFIPLRFLIGNG